MENIYEGKENDLVYDSITEEKPVAVITSAKESVYENPNVYMVKTSEKEKHAERRYDSRLIIFAIIATLQIVAIIVLIYLLNTHVKEVKHGDPDTSFKKNDPQVYPQAHGWIDPTSVGENITYYGQHAPFVLQRANVCFGSKDGQYGVFPISHEGVLLAIKLKYVSGYITCVKQYSSYKSVFGCNGPIGSYYDKNKVGVVITDDRNNLLFPKGIQFMKGFYRLPGYNGMKKTLSFTDYHTPLYALKGMELRIWYREDLIDYTEDENEGEVCVNVFAKFG